MTKQTFVYAGLPAVPSDPRLAFVHAESAKLHAADKAAADAGHQLAIAPIDPVDGFPTALSPYDPRRAVANRTHTAALKAADRRHLARIGEFERVALHRADLLDVMGNLVDPPYGAEDAADARDWVATLTLPDPHVSTPARSEFSRDQKELHVTSEINRVLMSAYLADPVRFEAFIRGYGQ